MIPGLRYENVELHTAAVCDGSFAFCFFDDLLVGNTLPARWNRWVGQTLGRCLMECLIARMEKVADQ